jgi:Protein of unknown function (DUF3551)
MRYMSSFFAAVSMLVAGAAFTLPAQAQEYPYCLQGRETGIPGDCNYRSYRECMASASGRNAFCGRNPRFAYDRERRWHSRQDYWH